MSAALHSRKALFATLAAGLALVLLATTGCGHKRHKPIDDDDALVPEQEYVTPQRRAYATPPTVQTPTRQTPSGRIPITPVPPGGVSQADLRFVATHDPIQSEAGLATWYTAPYKGRKAANGQVFDDHALTAAHRTLPMGSLIVVTNTRTGQSSAMRVTDRGPFVDGRILDLTIASAKATGVYRSGLVKVRIDVYQTPKPIDVGGRWCVQIGAFSNETSAIRLKQQLMRRYKTATVIEFPGENSYWVRIRPEGDNRTEAEYIAKHLRPAEGDAFLTRLD
ncbi:MAG: septal ring lytic transglycosylase RlpA family protein [Terracidiphilus sp.]|nr:septal ring lytic transglycosylase RlpA family protein [Terracidiphilus sp.]